MLYKFFINEVKKEERIPRIGIAESYGISVFNSWKNSILFFHIGYTSLHSCQLGTKVMLPSHPHQHFLFLVLLILAMLIGVRQFLIVVLIFISLMIIDIEHLFMCLLAICMSSLKICLFWSSAYFLIWLFGVFWCWVVRMFFLYKLYVYMVLWVFLYSLDVNSLLVYHLQVHAPIQ